MDLQEIFATHLRKVDLETVWSLGSVPGNSNAMSGGYSRCGHMDLLQRGSKSRDPPADHLATTVSFIRYRCSSWLQLLHRGLTSTSLVSIHEYTWGFIFVRSIQRLCHCVKSLLRLVDVKSPFHRVRHPTCHLYLRDGSNSCERLSTPQYVHIPFLMAVQFNILGHYIRTTCFPLLACITELESSREAAIIRGRLR